MAVDIGVEEMLERWGLRIIGGTLKNPIQTSTGGEATLDDDLRLVAYVESTPGYDRAAPVLKHLYSRGSSPGSFRLRLPGESRERALLRWGWFDLIGLRDAEIPSRVEGEFRRELRRRLREHPYHPSATPPETSRA